MEITKFAIETGNPIFETYLNDFDKVKGFYYHNFRSDWNSVIQKRKSQKFEREKIVEILAKQNEHWEAPAAVLKNISKLKSNNSFVIITGQQAGVFGGPLYTIYKIITTIKLAAQLSSEHPECSFIPCFWMEVDDHDFQEINHIRFFNKNNELHSLELPENSSDSGKPIYKRQINSEITDWQPLIKDIFHETEFINDVLQMFFAKYQPSSTYSDAFARLILDLFGQYGLIVLNPTAPEFKQLGMKLFEHVIRSSAEIREQLNKRNESLAGMNLPQQVHFQPQQTLFFYIDENDRRIRMDFDDTGNFILKTADGDEKIGRNTLIELAEKNPQLLSPNVALRPLFQDHVLPTVGYVAGPAEVAYFAQISVLYTLLDQPMPIIYPRHRMTIVESKIRRLAEKLEVGLGDLFQQRSAYLDSYIQQKQNENTFTQIESIRSELSRKLQQLEQIVKEADPTLINAIQKTEQRMQSSIEQIAGKITNSMKQKEATQIDQLKRILLFLFPQDNYQEREINILYFLIKYGPDFIKNLYENLPEDSSTHYIVNL